METIIDRNFAISPTPQGWAVSWTYPGIVSNSGKLRTLADIVVGTLGCDELCLGVELSNGDHEYVYIAAAALLTQMGSDLVEHYADRYVITSCVLPTESLARQLLTEFEKRLMWKRLQRAETRGFD
jgi:hypothetical protein